MATVALAHHADFVCGIPEITAFAHKDTCAELTLTGLSPGMMDGYFKKIGLRCTEQVLSEDQGLSHFTKAIRAYIDSGFPVILPVDQCRLVFGGKEEASVFKDNGISFEGRLENIAHAVLVIGYGVSSDSPFVFQDPAAMPFMVGTAKQLGEAGPVYPNSQNPDNGVIMPVTPAAIRLPLLQERFFSDDGEAKERQILTGLFVMAARFRGAFKFIHSDQPEGALGKFQLLQLPAQPGVETIQKDAARPKFVDLDQYLNRLLAIYGYEQRWVWVEIFDDAIWVWDAEATPRGALPVGESARDELFTSIGSFLVGVIFWDPNASQIRIKPETD